MCLVSVCSFFDVSWKVCALPFCHYTNSFFTSFLSFLSCRGCLRKHSTADKDYSLDLQWRLFFLSYIIGISGSVRKLNRPWFFFFLPTSLSLISTSPSLEFCSDSPFPSIKLLPIFLRKKHPATLISLYFFFFQKNGKW